MKKIISFMLAVLVMFCIQPIKATAADSVPDFIQVEVETNIADVLVEDYEDYIRFNDSFDYFEYASNGVVSAYCLTDNAQATVFEDGKEYILTINVTGAEGYVVGGSSTVECSVNSSTPITYTAQEMVVESETYYYFALTYHFAVPQRIMVDNVTVDIPVNLDGVSADDYASFVSLSSANVDFGSMPGEKAVYFYDKNDDIASVINYSKEYSIYISLKPREGYKFPEAGTEIPCTINGKNVIGTVASNGLLEVYFEGYATLKSIVFADFEYTNYKKGLDPSEIGATTQKKGIVIEHVFLANFDGNIVTDSSISEGMDYLLLVYFKAADGYIISELQEEGITVGGNEIKEYMYDDGSKMGCFSYSLPVLVHEHSGGKATCISKAKCSECFTDVFYGDIDPNNHAGDTEIKNKKEASCKEKGYTGDVYCLDCGNIAIAGEEIPKTTDHEYDSGVVTKLPTENEAGIRTYTCKKCGTKKTTSITPKKITPTVTLSKTSYTYNGKVQKPTVTVKNGSTVLPSDNYIVTYSSGCKNKGTYKVTVTLKGLYSGTATKTYTIKAKAITPTVTLSKTTYTYNGKVQKPTVTVKNGSSKLTTASYTVTYASGRKNVGKYKVTVKLKGNYSGTVTKTYKIKAKAITPTVTLSKTTYTYNGKVQKPTVTVKNGTSKLTTASYTVTYASGRKNVGKYKVTVKLKGNYSGTVTKTFTIKPNATSLSKLAAGTKKLTVTWKKLATQTSGYQIQYSTSSSFKSPKTVTVSKNTTTKKTISNLKSGKKYYVRIRTYKTVKINGKSTKIYSSWSKLMSVKVK